MAASGRKTRRKYAAPDVVSGNLARKLDSRELERRLEKSGELDFDQQYRQRRESEAERRARQRAKAKAAVRPAMRVSPAAVLGFASVAVLTVGLLLCYIQMSGISRNITSMKNRISQLEVEQVSLLARYEQSFDLASVKETAESAGMAQPSESQVYYIDLPGEDQAVAHAGGGGGALEGLLDSLRQRWSGLLEYFR